MSTQNRENDTFLNTEDDQKDPRVFVEDHIKGSSYIQVRKKDGESVEQAVSRTIKEYYTSNPLAIPKKSENIEDTLADRGSKYGSFVGHAAITQNIKRAMENSYNWNKLPDNMKEALEMVAHKIGRILNGDPEYKDSWVDIEGYVHLVSVTLKD